MQLDLFFEAIVAIDGSRFKAVNNRDKDFTDHKLKKFSSVVEIGVRQTTKGVGRQLLARRNTMKFMMLMIPAVYQGGKNADSNFVPDQKKMEEMGRFQ